MAPSSANLTTTERPTTIAANLTIATNATTIRPINVTANHSYGQNGAGIIVVTPIPVWWFTTTATPETGYYYYWDYSFYILVVFMLLLCVPLIFIKMAMRKRQQAARQVVLQRQQARRQAEININCAEGNCNGGNNSASCTANPTLSNATEQIDISILPKNYDLPPAYDEVILEHPNCKEQLKDGENLGSSGTIANAASTVTLATELEGSCNSLSVTTNNTIAEHSV